MIMSEQDFKVIMISPLLWFVIILFAYEFTDDYKKFEAVLIGLSLFAAVTQILIFYLMPEEPWKQNK